MGTKHTQGPWELQKTDRGYVIGDPITEYDICKITCHTSPPASAKCNAELIAASPELLAALEGLTKEINLSKLNIRKDFSLINAHAYALKVIRKAKGCNEIP